MSAPLTSPTPHLTEAEAEAQAARYAELTQRYPDGIPSHEPFVWPQSHPCYDVLFAIADRIAREKTHGR